MILHFKEASILVLTGALSFSEAAAQKQIPWKLPDTGQATSYTSTRGEDADVAINPLSFTDQGNGTVTDNNTGLMWQKMDGGEMTFENASAYCANLHLGGYADWRLPTDRELFSINQYDNINPALETAFFAKTAAEYWWTSEVRVDDSSRVWVVNAGGGIGAHPKSETKSAGGAKRFHVRAVRNPYSTARTGDRFQDNGDGTLKDNDTDLVWQKVQSPNPMAWEEALAYASALSLGGKRDWRVPNIKELQSLSDGKLCKPSFDKKYFTGAVSGNFWSSTTLVQQTAHAWDISIDYGIVSYNDKTDKGNVLCVRGGLDKSDLNISEVLIPGGPFEMGDHHGFVDPSHPSDEIPVHNVKVNSFWMSTTETTHQQFLAFLNDALLEGRIEVRGNAVYAANGTEIFYYTNQAASVYSIGYDGKVFSIADFRAAHPVVGVMWFGAAAYCNWLSTQNGLQECYNLRTGACDFTKNGYRLPTEAEWEYAGRGGQVNPYFIYPTGNTIDVRGVNLPASGDPYESPAYPNTTPVGFYDGKLKLKSEYNWPGSADSYQTSPGANAFGLYDMQGNVWEFVNDWYGQNYYSVSPTDNPKGPDSGFIMPDGKAYRGMRGGNWYNGLTTNGVNDGHSRVANRNPSYYRGPQDPNHPWYHVGFRTTRNSDSATNGLPKERNSAPPGFDLFQNYPNPFSAGGGNPGTQIRFDLAGAGMIQVKLAVYDLLGREVTVLVDGVRPSGSHTILWNAADFPGGMYFCRLTADNISIARIMILTK